MTGAWFGPKATPGLCQAIVSAMPRHRVFIEPHLGGGAVMKRKPPALRSIGIDPDRRAIDGFRRGHDVEPVHGCRHGFPAGFPFEGDGLVCSDPPCVQPARRPWRRCRFDCTDGDHAALPEILKPLPFQVTVSGYPSQLCGARLADWRSFGIQTSNRACVVTGKLWFSFAPGRPHWHTGAGRNFTDRQRIRRSAESRARRCRAMPEGERPAALAAVMAVEAERCRR